MRFSDTRLKLVQSITVIKKNVFFSFWGLPLKWCFYFYFFEKWCTVMQIRDEMIQRSIIYVVYFRYRKIQKWKWEVCICLCVALSHAWCRQVGTSTQNLCEKIYCTKPKLETLSSSYIKSFVSPYNAKQFSLKLARKCSLTKQTFPLF